MKLDPINGQATWSHGVLPPQYNWQQIPTIAVNQRQSFNRDSWNKF